MALITAFLYIHKQGEHPLIWSKIYLIYLNFPAEVSLAASVPLQQLSFCLGVCQNLKFTIWNLGSQESTMIHKCIQFCYFIIKGTEEPLDHQDFFRRGLQTGICCHLTLNIHDILWWVFFHFTGYQCVPLSDWTCMRCTPVARADLLRGCAHSG